MLNDIVKNMESRQFRLMQAAAAERLAALDPGDAARKAGGVYDAEKQIVKIDFLETQVAVSWPDGAVEPELKMWETLVLLHYLAGAGRVGAGSTSARSVSADVADGSRIRPSGRLMSFASLNDGMVRGHGFDSSSTQDMQRMFHGKSEEEIRNALLSVPGKEVEGRGDVSVRYDFLPNLPIFVNVWFADDEFPATGKMLLDETGSRYLSVEDCVTAGEILLERMAEYFERDAWKL